MTSLKNKIASKEELQVAIKKIKELQDSVDFFNKQNESDNLNLLFKDTRADFKKLIDLMNKKIKFTVNMEVDYIFDCYDSTDYIDYSFDKEVRFKNKSHKIFWNEFDESCLFPLASYNMVPEIKNHFKELNALRSRICKKIVAFYKKNKESYDLGDIFKKLMDLVKYDN